ncbi:polysaccharide deacetylase family protein [Roseobacter sp.]|uniref:polysaccharide deacetylase family protein n=1 Tax=Roseobacter sp. TaxID=1907202 RepID=UPI002966DF41|nr:polysaccharide deacetylase family protein [Roseobacter sp.]MDW3183180.1 polysaccharide deacetylase family protein [Roseobacter sp.]
MRIDWSPLRAELALWRAEKRVLPLWWRDDDAVDVTPALDELSQLATDLAMPVHLAVIPAFAQQTLVDCVAEQPLLVPTVHGWAHENRAPESQKKAEFGEVHANSAKLLERGLARLTALFGARLAPAFVAPWNRLHPDMLPLLVHSGYQIVSTFTPRAMAEPVPGLLAVNTHIDPIDWRGTRNLARPDHIIGHTVRHLEARRQGGEDSTEPLGYLTHHLVHTPDIWSFSHAFLSEMLDGGAVNMTLTQSLKETR